MSLLEAKVSKLLARLGLDGVAKQILAFAVVATLIPAIASSGMSYVQNKRSLTEKIAQELASAGSQAARELDLWSKERLYELRVFATSYEVSENLERLQRGPSTIQAQARNRLGDYLRSVRERFADYDELLVTDPSGQPAATSAGKPGPLPLPDDWSRRVHNEEKVFGDPVRDGKGRTQLGIAVPIVATNGRFLGAMIARVNLQSVAAMLDAFAPGGSWHVHALDASGAPMATDSALDAIPETALQGLREAGGAVVEYRTTSSGVFVGSLVDVPQLRWSVVSAIPRQDAYAQVARLRNATVLLLAVLLAVVGVIAYGMSRQIIRPLTRLTYGAARVAGGDLGVDLPVTAGGEIGYLTEVFNNMVTRLREGRKELERLTVTDGLTGLWNRRHLMTLLVLELERSQRHGHPVAVLMIDVDHFKTYNDTHGHLAGDDVLARLGIVLKETLRTVDHAARYGGEEFAVVMPETRVAGAVDAAERIRERLRQETFQAEGSVKPASITLSIGVAEFPLDGEAAEALLAAADGALYKAKKQGRDRVVATDAKKKASSSKRTT